MSGPTSTASSARRRQMLDVAAQLFATSGFHGVTVDDIGASMGVSGPALYHHFASKEALLAEMLISVSESLVDTGRGIVGSTPDADEALVSLVHAHVDFALDTPALIIVQHRDLVHAPEDAQQRVRVLQGEYVELWVEALMTVHPELDRRTARAATHAAFGLINSTPHSARISRTAMRSLLARMALGALHAASDAAAGRGRVASDAEAVRR